MTHITHYHENQMAGEYFILTKIRNCTRKASGTQDNNVQKGKDKLDLRFFRIYLRILFSNHVFNVVFYYRCKGKGTKFYCSRKCQGE